MADVKRKREQKGKEVMGVGQTLPPREEEVQRASKQAKTGQRGAEKRSDPQVVQASFRAKEMTNYCHRRMKEEEGRRIAAVEAFNVAEKSIQELKKKLQEEEKERKYAAAALENAEKQVKSQRQLLRNAEDQLASFKTQVATLKKKLEEVEKAKALVEKAKEEAEKAKEEAEKHGYDVRVAETEDTLKAEVLAICRTYCALTWGEALNQAGVEASSVLRKAKVSTTPQPYALQVL
ncbi:uncharacterized protein LOC136066439 [Quercus suber]|uniref:uncharacterized protein LOC136066439 n=1 Tax=Quercus suber TaxID=58331 RepID=UPI0032DEA201